MRVALEVHLADDQRHIGVLAEGRPVVDHDGARRSEPGCLHPRHRRARGEQRDVQAGRVRGGGVLDLDLLSTEFQLLALRPRRGEVKDSIMSRLDETYINGSMEHRLPGNLNMSFAYVEGESLLMGINDIAVSSGSACTSATLEPSYVLKALGTGDEMAHSSIRFGIGRFNTEAEVDYVADRVVETVKRLRELSPLYEMAKEGVDLKSVKWPQRR